MSTALAYLDAVAGVVKRDFLVFLSYRFRLLDASVGTALSIGTPVSEPSRL